MATVTMDIAELDKLRQQVKELTEKEKSLEQELHKVVVDKRVIVRYRKISKDDFLFSFNKNRYSYNTSRGASRYNLTEEQKLRECIEMVPLQNGHPQKDVYINFEDAKEELKGQLEEKYRSELSDLRHSAQIHDDRLRELKKDYEEEKRKAEKDHDEIVKGYIDKIAEELKRYEELETGKKELSEIDRLQEIIQKMEKELVEEKSKSWWSKLIGK